MRAQVYNYTIRERSMEEKEEEDPPSLERAVLPPTPGDSAAEGTPAVQPLDYRPTTGPASVFERCKAGTAPVLPPAATRPVQPALPPVQPLPTFASTSKNQYLSS